MANKNVIKIDNKPQSFESEAWSFIIEIPAANACEPPFRYLKHP